MQGTQDLPACPTTVCPTRTSSERTGIPVLQANVLQMPTASPTHFSVICHPHWPRDGPSSEQPLTMTPPARSSIRVRNHVGPTTLTLGRILQPSPHARRNTVQMNQLAY